MEITLRYGREGLPVTLPDGVDVVTTHFVPGLPDETMAIREALRQPIGSALLADLVKPGDTVVVAHSDITRATPNARLLSVLLAELEAAGVAREDITLL
ncbi:MAG: lactate racemase domain-containing protein, partial [Anaerolineae bacterium]